VRVRSPHDIRSAREITRRPLSLISQAYGRGDPQVLIPTIRRTWRSPGSHLVGDRVEVEADPGDHGALEPAPHHGGEAAPPRRVHEHEDLGSLQQVGVLGHLRVADRVVGLVREPFLERHRGPVALCVQVDDVDVVAGALETGDGPGAGRMAQALVIGVGDDDERSHQRSRSHSPACTAGHSSRTIEYTAVCRACGAGVPYLARWLRSTPSNTPPMRSMAARLRALAASVQIATRHTPSSSNAYPRRSSFASVLTAVRWAWRGEPRSADLDLVGQVAAAPPLRVEIPGTADRTSGAGVDLDERQHLRSRVVGDELLDVAGHLVAAVGHQGEVVRRSIDRGRLDETVDVVGDSGASTTWRPVSVIGRSGVGTPKP
jgi:hypothetical protein